MKKLLRTSVEKLPQEFREVYELRDLKEMPGDEAARKLGISRAAMKSRLHRARAMVREQLDMALAGAGGKK